jgi:hypothetical protein
MKEVKKERKNGRKIRERKKYVMKRKKKKENAVTGKDK